MADFFQAFSQWLWEWRKKISVTLAVVVAYGAGRLIPVPGYEAGGDVPFSIFQLGLFIMGGSRCLYPNPHFGVLQKTSKCERQPRFFFQKPVLLLALVITLGEGVVLSSTPYFPLAESGFMPLALVLVSYSVGSVICFYLGFIIERYGTGAGFWTMIWTAGMMRFVHQFHRFLQNIDHLQVFEFGTWTIWFSVPLVGLMLLSITYRLNSKNSLQCWAWPTLVIFQISTLIGAGTYYLGTFLRINPFQLYHIVLSLTFLVAIYVSLPSSLPALLPWLSVPILAVFLASSYFSIRIFSFSFPMLELLTAVLIVSATTAIFFSVSERLQHNRHVKSLKL